MSESAYSGTHLAVTGAILLYNAYFKTHFTLLIAANTDTFPHYF